MSTLREHKENENPANQPLAGTKEQVYRLLQHFDVLPSRFDQFVFRSIFFYMIGVVFLAELLIILNEFLLKSSSQLHVGEVLVEGGLSALPVVLMISVLWPFNIWRSNAPKTLRHLFEKKRIYLPDSDTNTAYFHFLENYRDALASTKRYLLGGVPMIVIGILISYRVIRYLIFIRDPNMVVAMVVVVVNLLFTFVILAGVYCLGLVIWALYISGWYVRKLVGTFEFNIEPVHTDKCGGLKSLGNFCFGLMSPLLIGSGLTIGYILLSLRESGDAVYLALTVVIPLLGILVYALPVAIFAFLLPLWDIHTKMVSAGETDEDPYNARIVTLREEIQSLLDSNQIEEAKVMQEKRALLETLHAPYPVWPFRFRSKIISTVLGVSGSLLIGVITAAFQQYFLPAILRILFHTP